ncbi:lanthionine synthetase LanC family protein [Bacillus cereus]|uniref:lanthionine synthetase LanC family protein n=1 Tax=Bacillus cereus TaxID=1396 RepID=UPI001155ACB8|nr:lanthionine synthetase LanC family protein [Bacillus cereus]
MECHDDDFTISRPRSRTSAKVIDSEAAKLLEEFRSPKNILEAVLNYSLLRRLDPEEVLNNAFPLLSHLREKQLLVPVQSEESGQIDSSLIVGTWVGEWEVLHCVQVLSDIEVYQVRNENGVLSALKVARKGRHQETINRVLDREAAIMRHLDGTYNPVLYEMGTHNGNRYLVMEWCSGKTASEATEELRNSSSGNTELRLLNLGFQILEAYAALHAQGVVHADVHPRNLLIKENGAVKIIDFGLARFSELAGDFKEPGRGGVGVYFEPEYAQAYLLGKKSPVANMLGEQYALGALLYLLLTGRHYLNFSLEKTKMFRQILEDSPLPFANFGREFCMEVEGILFRALSKNPRERFPSVAVFAQHLNAASSEMEKRYVGIVGSNYCINSNQVLDKELLETMLQRYGTSSTLISSGLSLAPTCSVAFGAAGIAYMFYRVACLRNDPLFLSTADLWVNLARRHSDSTTAFNSYDLNITKKAIGPVSLYHTVSGVHCVQALISSAMGDFVSLSTAIKQFVTSSRQPCENLDLTIGRSSTLIGCALLMEAIPTVSSVDKTPLLDLGHDIVDSIWSQIDEYKPIKQCRELTWLGIAHGWAGVLYATLRWCHAIGIAPRAEIAERIWQLMSCAEPDGHGVGWKRREGHAPGDNELTMGWCHGTAGYVHLLTLAYEMYKDPKLIRLAEMAAWHTWANLDRTSGNLCCGLSGQSYALLNLYKYTRDKDWLDRARKIGERAIAKVSSPSLRRHSLYKGDVGIALLTADLSYPELACMPLFESENSPLML